MLPEMERITHAVKNKLSLDAEVKKEEEVKKQEEVKA